MAVTVNGNASISVNPQETEALLVFVPGAEGQAWDTAAITKLAAEEHLSAHPDPKALETFLAKAAKAGTGSPLELVISRGTAPEDPAAEKINWEPLPVPADMAPFQEETLSGAKAPEIYRTTVEKVKHEKKVKKPGALPFMPGKEETEVVWEKKETRSLAEIDPRLLEVKYADRGKKLGTISPSVPGKPGKSVFGRPIPPQAAGDDSFLLGGGIAREKDGLSALVSGFVRIGANWADMIPLSKPSWAINTGIDGRTLFFHFEPGDARFSPPSGEEILAAAAAKGTAKESLIAAGELDAVISEAAAGGAPVEAYPLLRTREAEARVDINPDKTRAALYLCRGAGGALPLEMKTVGRAIKDSGVSGYDAEKLKADLLAFMQGKDLELKDYLLVQGKPSTRGKDRQVKVSAPLFSEDEQKALLPRLKAWMSRYTGPDDFDVQKATGFALVEKGADIASVSPSSEGEAGKDVYGNIIPGLPGNDPEIKLWQGLEIHGSGIRASQSGLLVMEAAEQSFRGRVIAYRDAKITVHISEDAMEARGDLFREEGAGIPLSLENILKVLAALGVKKGIDPKNAEKACILARARGSAPGQLLAKGEAPVAKGSSALLWLVSPGGLSEAADKSVQIKAGVPVAELSAPFAEGKPGYDVKGTEIPVEKGSPLSIEHDDSIREQTLENGKRLVAARSGELCFDGTKLTIKSVKTIEGDAGPATGNIKFSGEIRIGGNVLPGCAVIGGSHVIVAGIAEAALISAGGKAVVTLGMKGGGKGVIRAKAGIETAFAERGSVMAVGDVRLKRGSILSNVKTNGKILVSTDNGKLSGGIYQARYGIDAADIGSEKGLRTEISFGQDYLIKDEIAAFEEEIARAARSLAETEEKINAARQKNLPLPNDARTEKIRLVKLLEQLKLKVFTLREKFEEHYDSEIRIRGTVFPGVVIESHDRYYEVQQKRSRAVFYFDRETGRIKEKPLDG